MSELFNISQCNIAQLLGESNRFLFQALLVHITSCIIEGKKEIFSETLFKTLLITAVAIVMYHLFFRKIVEPKLEKMKAVCSDSYLQRMKKVKKMNKKDPLRPSYRKQKDKSISKYLNKQKSEIDNGKRYYYFD